MFVFYLLLLYLFIISTYSERNIFPSGLLGTMMELPNYSSQLMQQLWSLRKEGQFCDCTILVGDSPHRAHKLVLAASSMLFR